MTPALYRGFTTLALPLISLYLARRRAQGKEDGDRFPERLGCAGRVRPDGPLIWLHAASLGAALIQAGKPKAAERVFTESLNHVPNNGWALFGLMQAQKAQGDVAAAAKTEKLLGRAWAGDPRALALVRL